MQIIFVFETKNSNGSDYLYYKAIMDRFYKERGTGIKIQQVFMNGKGNYEKINKSIITYMNRYQGQTKVVYFLDVDCNNINNNYQEFNAKIIKYCEENEYEIVWFNKTIEEVLIGNIITRNKTEKAKDFFLKNKISQIEISKLNISNYKQLKNKESNVLTILDKYLEKK